MAVSLAPPVCAQDRAVGTDTHGITLELIMQDPEWIARSPEGAYWSDDGSAVYFRRQREGSDLRDLYRAPMEGGAAEVVSDADLPFADVSDADWSRDRAHKVFSRDGDLFLKDVRTSVERQLTRTSDRESRPEFMAGEGSVMYWRGGTLLVRDIESGLEWEPAEVRFDDPPDERRERSEREKKYLDRQQERYFEALREDRESRDERENRSRTLREINRRDVPGPFYLPKGLQERRRSLSPNGRWMIVVAGKRVSGDKRDQMPRFVTESGWVETSSVRPKVGYDPRGDDRVFLLDLEAETWAELERDGLPTIKEDPLAWLRESEDADEDAGDAEGQDDAESAGEDEQESEDGGDREKAKGEGKARDVGVMRVEWRPDGAMVAIMFRSNDNKDRWIGVVQPGAGEETIELVDHLRDEAWINWSFNELGWLENSEGLWFLSEASGYSDLLLWSATSRERGVLVDGAWEVSSVVESPGGELYFRGNRERPIEYQVYRVGPSVGSDVEQVSEIDGSVSSFSLSPDGTRLLLTASSAIRPPELYVMGSAGGDAIRLTETVEPGYAGLPWMTPEFVAIEGAQGRPIWTKVYALDGVWQGEGRPCVVFVHGAGYTQNSDDAWPYYFREQMFHSMLAHLGYVVLDMDYRASAGYGRDWRTAIYRNMGRPELEDLSSGIDWAVAEHGVDPDRVGIYGGSYGGFMALMALFLEPETYACGAALRPVTDWAHYHHGYTSNILNTPELDPVAFERSSPIEFAEGLADPLLICHGMVDDNVVFQDTVRLAQRLIELGKEDWEVAIYPIEPHSFTEASSWLDEYRRIFKLFERSLRGRGG